MSNLASTIPARTDPRRAAIRLTLTFLTFFILAYSLAQTSASIWLDRLPELVVYALLTGFSVVLSVPLARSELSVAHATGIVAFLSLPASVAPAMTCAIGLGGLIGSLGLVQFGWRADSQVRRRGGLVTVNYITARVTVSFFVASNLYLSSGAPLPAQTFASEYVLPMAIFALTYVALYLLIFILQRYDEESQVKGGLGVDVLAIIIATLLPIPFALIGAEVARRDLSFLSFTVTVTGIALIIMGLHVLNRSEQQLRRQVHELSSLAAATQMMRSTLDMDVLLRKTYEQIRSALEITDFTVALRTDGARRMTYPLVIEHQQERTLAPGERPPDYALIEHVLQTGQPLLLPDFFSERVFKMGIMPPNESISAWVGIPIEVGGRTLGVFSAATSRPERSFSMEDVRLLNILVSSAGIAIENARLYQQKSVRAEQLVTLNQVSALLTQTLSAREVLDTVVTAAGMISDANAVGVYLLDEDLGRLTLTRSTGLSELFLAGDYSPVTGRAALVSEEMSIHVMRLHELNDAQRDDAMLRALAHEGLQTLVELPLIHNGRSLGIIGLYFRAVIVFADEQLELYQTYAHQAAQAIHNALTYTVTGEALEQRVEQLFTLASLGRMLSAETEPERIYELMLSFACEATKAARGFIVLAGSDERLRVVSQRGYPEDFPSDPVALQQGLAAQVLRSGQPSRVDDTRQVLEYLPALPRTRSVLMVPIAKGSDVRGVIQVESDSPTAFSESDTHFLSQIANQTVIAVDNTQLFQRIREARDNMQAILNAMEEAILLIDLEQTIAQVNPRIEMIGLQPDDLLGRSISEVLDDPRLKFAERLGFSNAEPLRRLIQDLLNPGGRIIQPAITQYEIGGEQNMRFLQRQMLPIRDEYQMLVGLLIVLYDKTKERELDRARDSLSQMIVHDLRSPLTAVTTSLRLLQELVPQDSEYHALIDKTTDASRRAIRKVLTRVDSLLDIARMESGEMHLEREGVDLRTLVENVRTELAPMAHELEVRIRVAIPATLPLLYIDNDKVERLLLNLLDNALKYSPADTTVSVRAAHDGTDYVRIEVLDEGPGIPDEHKRRLFERYVQLEGRKVVRRGVGLGLTFCKMVTEAHGGEIWIEDNPEGQGSLFVVLLPALRSETVR